MQMHCQQHEDWSVERVSAWIPAFAGMMQRSLLASPQLTGYFPRMRHNTANANRKCTRRNSARVNNRECSRRVGD